MYGVCFRSLMGRCLSFSYESTDKLTFCTIGNYSSNSGYDYRLDVWLFIHLFIWSLNRWQRKDDRNMLLKISYWDKKWTVENTEVEWMVRSKLVLRWLKLPFWFLSRSLSLGRKLWCLPPLKVQLNMSRSNTIPPAVTSLHLRVNARTIYPTVGEELFLFSLHEISSAQWIRRRNRWRWMSNNPPFLN